MYFAAQDACNTAASLCCTALHRNRLISSRRKQSLYWPYNSIEKNGEMKADRAGLNKAVHANMLDYSRAHGLS